MERAKAIAKHFFEELGFSADDIPETDSKRADLDVNDGHAQYIVEVKEKLDTGSQLESIASGDLDSSRQITREPHARSNRLDGILKHGRKQLENTPSEPNAFNLLFLLAEGPNAEMVVRRSLYTFYGVRDLIPTSVRGVGVNCVYFDNSFAYSSPSIVGLLLVENRSLQLCLNEFSPSYDAFVRSALVKRMGDAIYDPSRFENDDGKIVLRSAVSRENEQDVLDEVERTTGVRYTSITLHRYNL